MRQLPIDELRRNIAIQLRVLRGPVKTALQHVKGDIAAETAANLIIERCFGNAVVFVPDRTPQPQEQLGSIGYWDDVHGRFGKTEPSPRAPAEPEHADRCRVCTANDIDGLALDLAAAMWDALNPGLPWDKAGSQRPTFLLLAQRAINSMSR